MSTFEWALLGHLVGVILFFSGIAVAGVAQGAAQAREQPAEIALLLRLTRRGVALVGIGTVLVLAFGFWLVDRSSHDFGELWLSLSFALFVVAFVLGALGGRRPKRARQLAEELTRQGNDATPELSRLLHDRLTAGLNVLALLVSVTILVLMIWRPGS